MIKVHHGGKMGDLVYALPAIRALARVSGEPVFLMTSPLCWQMVPLLWEQPYIADCDVDDQREYKITQGIFNFWEYYQPGEGINLSSQPSFFHVDAPVSWTDCYAKVAGVKLEESDYCIFPGLQNQRRYMQACDVYTNGKKQGVEKYVVIAPEVETLDMFNWDGVEDLFMVEGYRVVWIGQKFFTVPTTVPTMARIIADAAGFIGAHSFPWHLARHLEVPSICLQDWKKALIRCVPIDTPYHWYESHDYENAVKHLLRMMENDDGRGYTIPGAALTDFAGCKVPALQGIAAQGNFPGRTEVSQVQVHG